MTVTILAGDVHERLSELPADHFACVLSSPPYWGLRSYLDATHPDKAKEIGCEPTLGEHLDVMVQFCREVRRVLRPDGVFWLNYGDCYATSPNGRSAADTKARGTDDRTFRDKPFSTVGPVYAPDVRTPGRVGNNSTLNGRQHDHTKGRIAAGGYLKPKDLCLIPQRLAIALQEDGWWVRSLLPWVKRNGMPESINDRPASSVEYVIMLTKSARYAYDAESVRRAASPSTNARVAQNTAALGGSDRANGGAKTNGPMKAVVRSQKKQDATAAAGGSSGRRMQGFNDRWDEQGGKRRPGVTPKSAGEDTNIKAKGSFHASTSEVLNDRNFRNTDLFFDSLEPPFGLIHSADGLPIAIDICPQGFKEAHFACVDADTEALTPTGWKKHADLSDGESIAQYDPSSDHLGWAAATFHRYPFAGDLVAIEKRDSSQRLTPNHRCLIRRRTGRSEVVLAADLKPGMEVPTCASLVVQEHPGPGVDMAALLGWFVTEGEKKRGPTIRISQSPTANPEHCATIRGLLDRLGAPHSEILRQRTWRGRPAHEIVFSVRGKVADDLHGLSPDKRIDPAWVNWPLNEIAAFIGAVIDGDGHRRPDGRACVVQKDKGFLDLLQVMSLRLGWRGHVSPKKDGGFVLYLTAGRWLTLRQTNGRHAPIGREAYDGVVWCPSVPTGFWIARRDGKPFITGNTFPEAFATQLLRAGNPTKGPVLDPFGGAGTVGLVAERLGMDSTLIELNPESVEIADRRIRTGLGRVAGPVPARATDLPLFPGAAA